MAKPEEQIKEIPKEIPIEYEYDQDYRVIAAHGMYGGITPRGDLRVDFFVEYAPPPKTGELVYKPQPDGSVKEVSHKAGKPELIRRMQIGVLIPPQQVESFAKWFRDKAQKLKLMQDSKSKEVH